MTFSRRGHRILRAAVACGVGPLPSRRLRGLPGNKQDYLDYPAFLKSRLARRQESLGGHDFFQPVQQLPQRQGRHDVAALAVAFFRDETPGPVLGVDRPLGVIVNEVLLPDDLIKWQTHDRFPCPTRSDPLDRARYGSAPGTASTDYSTMSH